MPFTPYHMGPGILVKGLLQGGFSLMVFGWSQIAMDLQPLVAIVTRGGKLHGVTHTYVGATLIALFSAVTGKYLSQWVLAVASHGAQRGIVIGWRTAFVSAFIGAYSHVGLDSVLYADMAPLWPLAQTNELLGLVSAEAIHQFCVYSGFVGAVLYLAVGYVISRNNQSSDAALPAQGR